MSSSEEVITEASGQNEPAGRARLSVLPNQAPLREGGPMLAPAAWPSRATHDAPRALRTLAKIIDGGLCHRCGSCIGICPTGVLALDGEEYPTVKSLEACTDCDLCVRVCPGDEFDLHQAYRATFHKPADILAPHGEFSDATLAYANDADIRERSTSGGLVTAILLFLLENKQIDGAVVIASDDNILWKGRPIVARTREEILAAMKSKYAISPTNSVFGEIRNIPGRYALVGLPCQIHGYVKAAQLDPRIRERIVLTIGLFCHAAVEHDAFRIIWESLKEKAPRARRFISRIGKHPGTPHVELDDGTLYPVYFGERQGYRPSSMELINIIYRLYTPARCMTCFDGSAELADISIGDPWMAPPEDDVDFEQGWSFALIRTERARKVYDEMISQRAISSKTLTRREALGCNRIMFNEKRWRAFRIIETHRRQGKPVPSYGELDNRLPRQSGKQFVETELHMFTHVFCFLKRHRGAVLRFILSKGGYRLLWLNNRRRALRFWMRDTAAAWRRRLFGRR